jgi:hypothetical protein
MKSQFWAVGCGLWAGLDCEKKVWADYEQLFWSVFLSFHGLTINLRLF